MPSSPEKKKEQRKLRHERVKAKMAADPEYAAKYRDSVKAAQKRYEAKKKLQRFSRESSGIVGSGKPGRIVALCGWMNW